MHDPASWSLNLGRWGGVHVRLHVYFLLFSVCTFYLCVASSQSGLLPGDLDRPSVIPAHGALAPAQVGPVERRSEVPLTWVCVTALAILFCSVLLHEAAHAFAAVRVGGDVDELVLGPLGGLTQREVSREPQCELVAALAGPLANCAVALAIVPLLLLAADTSPLGLLSPLRPRDIVEGSFPQIGLKLAFWLNWSLALISLLPAYPFDGGRAARAVLWPVVGYRTAVLTVASVAKLLAAGICLLAWLMRDAYATAVIPAWVPLLLIAIFLYFSANREVIRLTREPRGDGLPDPSGGHDRTQAQGRLDGGEQPGLFARWREKRQQAREDERWRQEVAEEARMDTILARLHESEMESLPAEDRALLQRVSARYRSRAQQSGSTQK